MALDGSETRKPLLIALFVFAGCFAFCGLGAFILSRQLGGFGQVLAKSSSSNLEPLVGFAEPELLKEQEDGWRRYRFQDLGLEMDLADGPRAGYLKCSASDVRMKGWALYYITAASANANILAVDYRKGLGSPAQYLYYYYAKASGIQAKPKKLMVDGHACLMGEGTRKHTPAIYRRGGDVVDGLVILRGDDHLRVLRYSRYDNEEDRKSVRRLLSSVRFIH